MSLSLKRLGKLYDELHLEIEQTISKIEIIDEKIDSNKDKYGILREKIKIEKQRLFQLEKQINEIEKLINAVKKEIRKIGHGKLLKVNESVKLPTLPFKPFEGKGERLGDDSKPEVDTYNKHLLRKEAHAEKNRKEKEEKEKLKKEKIERKKERDRRKARRNLDKKFQGKSYALGSFEEYQSRPKKRMKKSEQIESSDPNEAIRDLLKKTSHRRIENERKRKQKEKQKQQQQGGILGGDVNKAPPEEQQRYQRWKEMQARKALEERIKYEDYLKDLESRRQVWRDNNNDILMRLRDKYKYKKQQDKDKDKEAVMDTITDDDRSQIAEEQEEKRGRGRPRKHPIPIRRGPGRPRKNQEEEVQVQVKRRRGRPRKSNT